MSDCTWYGTDPLYKAYHDEEWGYPVTTDPLMFEFLILETFQAGLSWITVLRKREAFREAFHHFDAQRMSAMTPAELESCMINPGIIRNRAKIEAAVGNAKAYLAMQAQWGSFAGWWWNQVGFQPIVNAPQPGGPFASTSPLSDHISKELKKAGFKFVGSTVVYAHLQATGLVNDHLAGCSAQNRYRNPEATQAILALKDLWASRPQNP
jgi:DNA-3-methyladenine glycosylase I